MDNSPGSPFDVCPKCKAPVVHHWDEEYDREPPDPVDDPDEELASRVPGRRRRRR